MAYMMPGRRDAIAIDEERLAQYNRDAAIRTFSWGVSPARIGRNTGALPLACSGCRFRKHERSRLQPRIFGQRRAAGLRRDGPRIVSAAAAAAFAPPPPMHDEGQTTFSHSVPLPFMTNGFQSRPRHGRRHTCVEIHFGHPSRRRDVISVCVCSMTWVLARPRCLAVNNLTHW